MKHCKNCGFPLKRLKGHGKNSGGNLEHLQYPMWNCLRCGKTQVGG